MNKYYKVKNLFIGIIAKQGGVTTRGGFLDGCFHWDMDNFDVGIFIKKSNNTYLRVTTRQIYKSSDHTTEYQIVINRKYLHNLAQHSPELAKKYQKLELSEIADIEKLFFEKWIKSKSTTNEEEKNQPL